METAFAVLTLICPLKKAIHRAWRYFTMRLAATVALFNLLAQWGGPPLDDHGCAHRSIAHFSL